MAKRIQAILSLKDDFSSAIKNAREASVNFGKEWERQGKKISRTAEKFKEVGKVLSASLTPLIGALGTVSINTYSEMDAGLDTLVAKSGAVGKELERNKEAFEELYRSTAFSADDIGMAMGSMQAYTDATGLHLENLSEYALQFSKVTGGDVAESITMAARMMQQFDATTADLPHIFDAMAKAMQDSGVDATELFDVVQENVPQLKELGMGFEEAFAFAGQIGKAGFQMDRIFDSIKDSQSVLGENGYGLADGLKVVQKELAEAASDTDRLAVAIQYFGEENAAYMLEALDQGVVTLDDFSRAVEDSSGTVSETYGNMAGPIEKLTTVWHDLKSTAGDFAEVVIEGGMPVLEALSERAQTLSAWLRGLDDDQKRVIATIVALAAVVGPLVSIIGIMGAAFGQGFATIGTLVTGFKTLTASGSTMMVALKTVAKFMTGPWGIAITAAITAGVLLYQNWDTVKELGVSAFKKVTKWINSAKDAIGELKEKVTDFIKNSKIGKIGSMVGNAISNVASHIGSNAEGTNYWRGGLTMVHESGGELIDLPRGSRVYPHDQSVQMAYQDGALSAGGTMFSFEGATFVVREEADIESIARTIVRRLTLTGKNRR